MFCMNNRLKNGRFVTKKVAARNAKALDAMSKIKKKGDGSCSAVNGEGLKAGIAEGRRIVELKVLGEELVCLHCKRILSLKNIIAERRMGLHSVLTVECQKCKKTTTVNTGKKEKTISHINLAIVLGAIHSGIGSTALSKILACADIPCLANDLYKRYEKQIGKAIENEARDSCRRGALEERKLVIQNVTKLCEEL